MGKHELEQSQGLVDTGFLPDAKLTCQEPLTHVLTDQTRIKDSAIALHDFIVMFAQILRIPFDLRQQFPAGDAVRHIPIRPENHVSYDPGEYRRSTAVRLPAHRKKRKEPTIQLRLQYNLGHGQQQQEDQLSSLTAANRVQPAVS
jgi:hypothetical protein